MNEPDELARDRRLYHLHAATLIVGFFGLIGTMILDGVFVPRVTIWVAMGFSVLIAVSGVLAIIVKRTLFSKQADDTDGLDFEGHPGDAIETPGIWSGNLSPKYTNTFAPVGVLFLGLAFFGFFLWWALFR
jgi:hypothetical protein